MARCNGGDRVVRILAAASLMAFRLWLEAAERLAATWSHACPSDGCCCSIRRVNGLTRFDGAFQLLCQGLHRIDQAKAASSPEMPLQRTQKNFFSFEPE